jgi:hypothetical protein
MTRALLTRLRRWRLRQNPERRGQLLAPRWQCKWIGCTNRWNGRSHLLCDVHEEVYLDIAQEVSR